MEIFRALGVLIEPPDAAGSRDRLRIARLLDLADSESALPPAEVYTDLFLFQLYPFASVYLGDEGMMGGEARDRIAGFLRALGSSPPAEPDHLSFLLAAYADLAAQDADAVPDDAGAQKRLRARKAFLWEHLLSWLPAWLRGLRRLRPPDFYLSWADLVEESLRREAALLGPPTALPLHLREASPLADPNEDGAEAFLQSLLTPARSGIVLVRDDLRSAAERLGLGLRAGERRYIVEHLLGQDADAFLGWLADEAECWVEYWRGQTWLASVAAAWGDRAASTSAALHHAS